MKNGRMTIDEVFAVRKPLTVKQRLVAFGILQRETEQALGCLSDVSLSDDERREIIENNCRHLIACIERWGAHQHKAYQESLEESVFTVFIRSKNLLDMRRCSCNILSQTFLRGISLRGAAQSVCRDDTFRFLRQVEVYFGEGIA